ncbi:MerR family transcriptional regulator [Bacillus solimangrovi]|uniref:HTH merR-type domain-containing protein n=1 Tax=Bacillus solimangrovi TaxID=1305675 RepID=A0A1E5LFZ8_9BACI|nr:MerR family transcriptional regulator [Bacillus solimangrovi]OEH92993.1 hypothetical protein BFG57_14110 [Bacillus solimangrovi]
MQEALKTREVSSRLGVAPRTVRKWIKDFNIPCEKNDNGHYLITENVLRSLQEVKHIDFEERDNLARKVTEEKESVDISNVLVLVTELTERINHLERQLEQKADEVVSYQVLQHRTEIDGVVKRLEQVEDKFDKFDKQLSFKLTEEEVAVTKSEKRNWLANMFSL